MTELDPTRKAGESAEYEEGPFDLGHIAEQDLVVVQDVLPSPEELVLKEPATGFTRSIGCGIISAKRLVVPEEAKHGYCTNT